MPTYTFAPNLAEPSVDWDDPAVWVGSIVPNGPDADVVFPPVIIPSTGGVYSSVVTIKPSEAYAVRSISDTGTTVVNDGELSVSGALNFYQLGDIEGSGSLSVGSSTGLPGGVDLGAIQSTTGDFTLDAGSGTQIPAVTMGSGMTPNTAVSTPANPLANPPAASALTGNQLAGSLTLALPVPVDGVVTTGFTSLDLTKLFGQGYGLQFVSGTEALQLTDGTLSVGPDTTQALVQRLYEGLLGRPGDALGLAGFNAQLVNGGSPDAVTTAIIGSSEYQALHGTQSDTQFVSSLYQGFLGRAPDQPNLSGWVNVLAQGSSRGQVAASFAQSPEAKTNLAATTAHVWVPDPQGGLVTELYETGLGRAPDLPALQAWKQQLTAGLTPQQLAQGIASSVEFNADHAGSSYPDFVTSLYQAGLGRAPAPGEVQGWVGQLQAGASPASVLYGIATSGEAATHLLPSI